MISPANWMVGLLVAAGALAPAAGATVGEDGPPRVLILTFDTTRADHLSAYGGAAAVPALDRLAREGLRFDRAFAPTPMTLPSHASLFTGLYPIGHGVLDNGSFRLSDEAGTLAERLRTRGFRTAAFVGSRVLDSRYGLDQGFDTYDDEMPPEEAGRSMFLERPASAVADRALAWLEEAGDGPWLLWAHFFDPHWEYRPPEPYRSRYPDSPYDGEIAYAAAEAGRILEWLTARRLLDRTIVVATADHGESLGEHGEDTHGIFLYDATVRVPLLIRYPPLGAGKQVDGMASLVDVVPTLLTLVGIPYADDEMHGVDLMRPQGTAKTRSVWLESWGPLYQYGWSHLVATRDQAWKYVQAPRPELYDLTRDPAESVNLAREQPERLAGRREELSRLADDLAPRHAVPARPQAPDAGERQALTALGYISLGATPDGRALPDPKDRIGDVEAIMDALEKVYRQDWEAAVPALQEQVGRNPRSPFLRHHLGTALVEAGRQDAGIRELRRSLELDPDAFTARDDLGSALFRAGRLDEAETEFRETLRRNPHVALAWHNLGLIEQTRGRSAEAIPLYERALEEDPSLLRAIVNLGTLLEKAGQAERALALYLRAAELDPGEERTFFSAAFLLFQGKRFQEALEVLGRAAEAHPRSPRPPLYRARVYHGMGDLDAAERELRRALELDPASEEARRMLATLQRQREAEGSP